MTQKEQTGLFFDVRKSQPKHLRDVGDSVHWTSVDDKGKKSGLWRSPHCYASIMNNLAQQEILCRSRPREKVLKTLPWHNRLRPHDYERLMNLHKEAGMIPQEVQIFSNRHGNCMLVPRAGYDRHTVYVTLCLYRYADSRPLTMKTILDLYDQLNLPWLQVYHYGMACRGVGPGHGFISFEGGISGSLGTNPATGMALCRFASLPLEERAKLKQGARGSTYEYMTAWTREVNLMIQAKLDSPGHWGHGNSFLRPQYMLRRTEQLLDPRLSSLYTDPSLTKEDFVRVMGQFREDDLQ